MSRKTRLADTEVEVKIPTVEVTEVPTEKPTEAPTETPTVTPTEKPTEAPTEKPTEAPSATPTEEPAEDVKTGTAAEELERVERILKSDKSIDVKLRDISKLNNVYNKKVLSKLVGYDQALDSKLPFRGVKYVAGKNYDLYNTIKGVLATEEYREFKVKFDLVNMIFNQNKKSTYNEFMLRRGVEEWTWGPGTFNTYSIIVTIVCALCDPTTRSKNIHKLNFNTLEQTVLNDKAKENIKRYYGL